MGKARKHGESIGGMTRLYHIWHNMTERCKPDHPRHERYYDRGISVCDEWKSSENFFKWAYENGYREDLTLDRVDNDKGYHPDNCKWSTDKEQSRNRHTNRMITFRGETKCLAEWSEILGIHYSTLSTRLKSGKSVEESFTTPVRTRGGNK